MISPFYFPRSASVRFRFHFVAVLRSRFAINQFLNRSTAYFFPFLRGHSTFVRNFPTKTLANTTGHLQRGQRPGSVASGAGAHHQLPPGSAGSVPSE